MPSAQLPYETQKRIYDLANGPDKPSARKIAAQLGIHNTTVLRYAHTPPVRPVAEPEIIPDLHAKIKASLRKQPMSDLELADALDCGPSKIREAIAQMKTCGVMLIAHVDGRHDLGSGVLLESGKSEAKGSPTDTWTHYFGVTTDNHLCNKHARLDVLKAAYDHFEREGISTVFNCGNWIDGEARFNKTELIVRPGTDAQLDYLIDKWPVRKGIETHYVAGSDHEGWAQEREGIEIGRYLQTRAELQGRNDLKYLGYAEADVALKIGDKSAVMRVLHPGGGSAYAISYTDQKRVESYQGGEKPQVELVGHFHKFCVGYPREVYTVQCGCCTDQSLFMRKKRLQAHVGFVTLKIKQDPSDGHITRLQTEWFPFYDRGYYEKRF
jgi:hypothetical protein